MSVRYPFAQQLEGTFIFLFQTRACNPEALLWSEPPTSGGADLGSDHYLIHALKLRFLVWGLRCFSLAGRKWNPGLGLREPSLKLTVFWR